MTTNRPIPAWVTDCVAEWKTRLMLCEWQIATALSSAPNGDPTGDTRAVVNIGLHVRKAKIDFLDTIPDDLTQVDEAAADEWRQTIIHELLHVRLCVLEAVVKDDIAPQLGPQALALAESAWRREYESAIDILAWVLLLGKD